ncbi:hypothetical protein ASE48_01170 [Mycobacterium sp. Root265]|uniref:hypothetical protein n=1 Tax=Mycobacterium sp. Root265 TaxID=1736504 RepID=UPI00070A1167|nr:hypothetical protein [Mycobacterium sp. Root265]KRD20448.1 hypothetical protein ASE48_01170 [Mycobacterium sp. Root265]
MTTHTEISVAGVPWPMYKALALIIGALVLVVVGVATASLGPAVLTAAGAATLVWLAGGMSARR